MESINVPARYPTFISIISNCIFLAWTLERTHANLKKYSLSMAEPVQSDRVTVRQMLTDQCTLEWKLSDSRYYFEDQVPRFEYATEWTFYAVYIAATLSVLKLLYSVSMFLVVRSSESFAKVLKERPQFRIWLRSAEFTVTSAVLVLVMGIVFMRYSELTIQDIHTKKSCTENKLLWRNTIANCCGECTNKPQSLLPLFKPTDYENCKRRYFDCVDGIRGKLDHWCDRITLFRLEMFYFIVSCAVLYAVSLLSICLCCCVSQDELEDVWAPPPPYSSFVRHQPDPHHQRTHPNVEVFRPEHAAPRRRKSWTDRFLRPPRYSHKAKIQGIPNQSLSSIGTSDGLFGAPGSASFSVISGSGMGSALGFSSAGSYSQEVPEDSPYDYEELRSTEASSSAPATSESGWTQVKTSTTISVKTSKFSSPRSSVPGSIVGSGDRPQELPWIDTSAADVYEEDFELERSIGSMERQPDIMLEHLSSVSSSGRRYDLASGTVTRLNSFTSYKEQNSAMHTLDTITEYSVRESTDEMTPGVTHRMYH